MREDVGWFGPDVGEDWNTEDVEGVGVLEGVLGVGVQGAFVGGLVPGC